MPNYYQYKIDSGIDTFSQFEAGVNFKFESTTISSDTKFENGDLILGVKLPSSIYVLLVDDFNSNEISLTKLIEVDSDFQVNFENNRNIKKIDEEEYEFILKNVLNGFVDLKSNSEKNNSLIEIENIKEEFANWLFDQGKYKRVYKGDKSVLIEKLSEYGIAYENDFGISIFDFPNLSINTIIGELESNLIDESGQIGDLNKRTVGNGSVKAILGPNNYIKFLKELLKQQKVSSENLKIYGKQIDFDIKSFQDACKSAGLIFSSQLLKRFTASLSTKPFVLLSGLSGSGKTKLAEAFAMWVCESEEQYALIPVGADWTNREPLLGYPNALKDSEYVKPDNDALDLLLRAKDDENRPYFLILDEMNLSHVERYFADFLSTMESKNSMPLHKMEEEVNDIPNKIKLPKNLFIVGTVNIDETTYMFSPKVLDRANTIEFRVNDTDISDFLKKPKDIDLEKLNSKGVVMATNFVEIATATKNGVKIEENYQLSDIKDQDVINNFFIELQKAGAEFGYRTAFEMSKLIYKLEEFGLTNKDDKLDIAIMQKMLPKLHGSRTKLTRTLKPLAKLCLKNVSDNFDKEYFENFENINFKKDGNIRYKLSFEKIMRMYKNAVENGFASYAEA